MKTNPQSGNAPANSEKIEDGKTSNPPSKRTVKYTLGPLVADGRKCLACRDVEGMESVHLEWVEFYYGGSPWQRTSHRSDDIFALVENEICKWPALERISAARFQVRLKGERRARSLTVRPATRWFGSGDAARLVMEDWLVKRKFAEIQNNEG